MASSEEIVQKVNEIKAELQRLGLWQSHAPAWVGEYKAHPLSTEDDFGTWLQFIYLPNQLDAVRHPIEERQYIVPQAVSFFSSDLQKGKVLQLLIELDALI